MYTDIIANIKDRRKELGINQEELSKKLGICLRSVQRYEHISNYDQMSAKKIKTLANICELLGLTTNPDLDKLLKKKPKTLFGEPIDCVQSILLSNGVWYTGQGNNCLQFYFDLTTEKDYFSFWLHELNPIDDAERITGEISAIQAVTVS